ncbi:hypothetical protein L2E82_46073 [Cichorium intybus]|uniref:Uncharacterized protein n=1 Tax=Cichorium intybus TaxID=13427 RepID=A0ACB8YSH2_CICIN|nr:hypothetical protein L2E82_46073 [Cichorium intybus]
MMYRLEPKKPHMFSFFEINIIIPRTWQNFNFTLDSSNSRSLSSITQRPNSIFLPPFLCILSSTTILEERAHSLLPFFYYLSHFNYWEL